MSNSMLRVYLVHGTWNVSASWAQENSAFRQMFNKNSLGYLSVEFSSIKWSG